MSNRLHGNIVIMIVAVVISGCKAENVDKSFMPFSQSLSGKNYEWQRNTPKGHVTCFAMRKESMTSVCQFEMAVSEELTEKDANETAYKAVSDSLKETVKKARQNPALEGMTPDQMQDALCGGFIDTVSTNLKVGDRGSVVTPACGPDVPRNRFPIALRDGDPKDV